MIGEGREALHEAELLAALDETSGTVVAERVRRADTFATRLVGLLNRASLDADEGLLIDPCRAIHTLGMRFAIDAVFLDPEGAVVEVAEAVAPWRMTRVVRAARSVLELPAGRAREAGLRVGHRMDFVRSSDDAQARLRRDGRESQR